MAKKAGQQQKKPAIFLIYGGDGYLVTEAARRVVDAWCPEAERAFGLDEVQGDARSQEDAVRRLRQCLVALRTVGFSGGRKLVWFRNVTFLKNAATLKAPAVQPWVAELTALVRAGLPEGHRLLITAPGVDGRSAFVKACREAGEVQEYSVPERAYQAKEAARGQARQCLDRAGLKIGESVLSLFLDRAGYDTRQIVSEIEKLSLALGEKGVVTAESVQDIVSVSRTSEGWDLADAVAQRKAGAALALVRRLLFQKIHWGVLVGTLEARFRELLVIRECMDRGWLRKDKRVAAWSETPEIDAVLGGFEGKQDPRSMHPYRLGILMDQARNFSLRGIEARRRLILQVREKMVSGFTDPDLLLEFMVLRLAGRIPAGRSKSAAAGRSA